MIVLHLFSFENMDINTHVPSKRLTLINAVHIKRWCMLTFWIHNWHCLCFFGGFRLVSSGVRSRRVDWPASPEPVAPWSHSDPSPVGWSGGIRWQQRGAQRPQLLPFGEERIHITRNTFAHRVCCRHVHAEKFTWADKPFSGIDVAFFQNQWL